MKRGTTQHPKMYDLANRLSVPHPHAIGILTLLWEYASTHTPMGDIGSVPDKIIAEKVGWPPKKALLLICALVDSKWVDEHAAARMAIHDWAEHCEFEVCRLLHRNGKDFLATYGKSIYDRGVFTEKQRGAVESSFSASRESHGSRVAMALVKASAVASALEKSKKTSLPKIEIQPQTRVSWEACGFSGSENCEVWWRSLVAKHSNRTRNSLARERLFELLATGQFNHTEFELWYEKQIPIWSEWASRGVQAPNLKSILDDCAWKYPAPLHEDNNLSPTMRAVLAMGESQ